MKIRAVIFDVYKTLLEVGPPPAGAADLWESLWEDRLAAPARLSLEAFTAECDRIIGREHAAARAVGVDHPEIYWPAVAKEAMPELRRLNDADLDDFLHQHAQLQRVIRLMPGAGVVLQEIGRTKTVLGIASNAQPYTLRELDAALAEAGLTRKMFTPELCFWSYAAGFSKPDPHVFRWLCARLAALGIPATEALLVGDRLDNDIEPATPQGFQTWRLTSNAADGNQAGDWEQLGRRLAAGIVAGRASPWSSPS
jgi:FMN phosphatase YigB (HAD superfamily)